jgi:glyoxylase-like metal-dependent hydrolase (beta-lactamase superfamily II)
LRCPFDNRSKPAAARGWDPVGVSETRVRRVIPLTVGWERLPKAFSLHGDTSGEIIVEPVTAVLLDTDDGWALIDTGMNSVLIRDEPLFRRLHGRNGQIVPILPESDGEPLEDAIGGHGVALTDITRIYLSHLHNDHAGGLRLFDPSIPVLVQRKEFDWGMSGHPGPERYGTFRIDYDDPLINWQLLDGDRELAPGIRTVFTPGHSPGHQSFVIDLPDGGYVFAFDAADLIENVEQEIAPGGFVDCGPEVGLESLLRLKAVAAELGYPVIPGHCPVTWPALTAALV